MSQNHRTDRGTWKRPQGSQIFNPWSTTSTHLWSTSRDGNFTSSHSAPMPIYPPFHKWILPNISSKPPWHNCRPFLCVPPLAAKQTNSPHAAALFQAVTESNICLQTPPVKFSSLCHLSCHFIVPSPALPLFTECIASTQYLCCREGPKTSFCNTDIQPLSYPFSTSTLFYNVYMLVE